MTTSKLQTHIDSAGRLAAIMTDLGSDPVDLADVLMWCVEANVALANDTKIPTQAVAEFGGAK